MFMVIIRTVLAADTSRRAPRPKRETRRDVRVSRHHNTNFRPPPRPRPARSSRPSRGPPRVSSPRTRCQRDADAGGAGASPRRSRRRRRDGQEAARTGATRGARSRRRFLFMRKTPFKTGYASSDVSAPERNTSPLSRARREASASTRSSCRAPPRTSSIVGTACVTPRASREAPAGRHVPIVAVRRRQQKLDAARTERGGLGGLVALAARRAGGGPRCREQLLDVVQGTLLGSWKREASSRSSACGSAPTV